VAPLPAIVALVVNATRRSAGQSVAFDVGA